jgi:N-acetylglucosamine-6-phosphate deacetylase
MTRTITARHLITDTNVVDFPVLSLSEDGVVTAIDSDPRGLAGEETTLTATFFDVHTHGAMGHDVMDASPAALAEMQRFLAARGVGYYLPTTVTASVDDTLRALDALATAIEAAGNNQGVNGDQARPVGIHLEGPFLSHEKRGVHPPDKLQPPSIELFQAFQQAARGHISLVTVAPELPGMQGGPSALDLIGYASQRGVRVSMGHSNATAAEARAGIEAGASSATHTYNAMRALDHRDPGILGTVLDDDRLYAELICDGVHVVPPLVRLWLKAKSARRAILVTDAMSAAGMPDGKYTLAGQTVLVADGRAVLADDLAAGIQTLAGSVLTMDRAVSNLQAFTGASLGDATRLASHNPAAMLGRPELTCVAVGSAANLNRFDARGQLIATYLQGRELA